jgi:hypothetical protein
MDIIKTITDWPVIVQGALGSALFWVILELGQRLANQVNSRLSKDQLAANIFALVAHEAKGDSAQKARFMCIYAAIHYFAKAAIVTMLSIALGQVFGIFATVGYLIAVFFLFRALAFVPHTANWGSPEQRENKFNTLIASAGKSKDNSSEDNQKPSHHSQPNPSFKRDA